MPATVIRMPPRGHYQAWEAGQLAGVSGQKMGQWARRGYIKSSQSETTPRVYAFQDVAEAMVVHELLERGVTHREIRKALELMHEYGDWPLTEAPLATLPAGDRARLLLQRGDEETYDIGKRGWQQVIQPESLEELRSQLRRGGWAVRNLPDLRHIEVDPDLLAGRPAIKGTRIAAYDVVQIAESPGGIDELREGYDLNEEQIADARRWWREVRRLEAA